MDCQAGFRLQPRWVLLAIVVGAALAGVFCRSRHTGELPVYMKAAERLVQGEEIYRPDDPPAFTYPPFFALPQTLLVPLEPSVRRYVWCFANLELLAVILWIVTQAVRPTYRRFSVEKGPPAWVAILLIAILSGRFVISPIEYESHDQIIFLLMLLAAVAMGRAHDGRAGVFGGLATACKATPLLLLPVLAWQRRFRGAILMVAAMALATFLPDLLFPSPDGRPWVWHWYEKFVSKVGVGAAPDAAGAWSAWNQLNQSLAGTLYRLATPIESEGSRINVCLWQLEAGQLRALTISLQLAIVGFLAWATRLRVAKDSDLDPGWIALGQVGMVLCAMLLLSPMSSSQHFCVLLVPVTVCVVHWLYVRRDWTMGLALAAVFVLGALPARDLLGRFFGDACQAAGCKTFCTLILFWASSRAK